MAAKKDKVKVVFFQRKPRKVGNYSVEIYYDEIRRNLPSDFEPVKVIVPYESTGFFKRLANAVYCAFHQGDINHITGDIHYVALFLQKKKTILTVLDCGMLKTESRLKRYILKTFWFTLPVKKCSFITVISNATRQDLLRYVNFPPEKIKVIYVSISRSFNQVPKTFNKQKPVILQIGTAANKNIKRLAEALKDINCKLVVIGKHDEPTEHALRQNTIDYSYISRRLREEEVISHYHDADLISFVSTLEGFGMSIVEGNTVGRPVITSNVSSMPEVAADAAHLVNDPQDVEQIREGIKRIIHDDEYRDQLIYRGYRNAKRFSIDTVVKEHIDLYHKIIQG